MIGEGGLDGVGGIDGGDSYDGDNGVEIIGMICLPRDYVSTVEMTRVVRQLLVDSC